MKTDVECAQGCAEDAQAQAEEEYSASMEEIRMKERNMGRIDNVYIYIYADSNRRRNK